MGAEIVVPVLCHVQDVIEVPFIENEHSIQNLVLQSLNHSFHVCPQIWCTGRHLGDRDARFTEDLIEGGWVSHVVVAQQDRQREIGEFGMLVEPLGLLSHPRCIGFASGGGEPESARADVDEGQDVKRDQSLRCPDGL